MHSILTSHGALAYTSVGTGRPLVLLHGNSYTAATQERLAHLFADEHHVISVDLLGHGRSARPSNLFGLQYFTMQGEALGELLTALFPTTRVAVFGMSAGGITALNAMCIRSERVAALILDGVFRQVSAQTVAAHQQNTVTMSRTWSNYMAQQHGVEWWPQLLEGIQQTVENLAAAKTVVTPCLEGIHVPTLIFQGGQDQFVPNEQAHAVLQTIPGARMIYDPEAGHLLAWKDSIMFRETVRGFLHEIGYMV